MKNFKIFLTVLLSLTIASQSNAMHDRMDVDGSESEEELTRRTPHNKPAAKEKQRRKKPQRHASGKAKLKPDAHKRRAEEAIDNHTKRPRKDDYMMVVDDDGDSSEEDSRQRISSLRIVQPVESKDKITSDEECEDVYEDDSDEKPKFKPFSGSGNCCGKTTTEVKRPNEALAQAAAVRRHRNPLAMREHNTANFNQTLRQITEAHRRSIQDLNSLNRIFDRLRTEIYNVYLRRQHESCTTYSLQEMRTQFTATVFQIIDSLFTLGIEPLMANFPESREAANTLALFCQNLFVEEENDDASTAAIFRIIQTLNLFRIRLYLHRAFTIISSKRNLDEQIVQSLKEVVSLLPSAEELINYPAIEHIEIVTEIIGQINDIASQLYIDFSSPKCRQFIELFNQIKMRFGIPVQTTVEAFDPAAHDAVVRQLQEEADEALAQQATAQANSYIIAQLWQNHEGIMQRIQDANQFVQVLQQTTDDTVIPFAATQFGITEEAFRSAQATVLIPVTPMPAPTEAGPAEEPTTWRNTFFGRFF